MIDLMARQDKSRNTRIYWPAVPFDVIVDAAVQAHPAADALPAKMNGVTPEVAPANAPTGRPEIDDEMVVAAAPSLIIRMALILV